MKHLLRPVIWLLVVATVCAGITAVAGRNFWWVFAIVAIAILANGLLA